MKICKREIHHSEYRKVKCFNYSLITGFHEVSGTELPLFIHTNDLGCLSLHNETRGRLCLGKRSDQQHLQVTFYLFYFFWVKPDKRRVLFSVFLYKTLFIAKMMIARLIHQMDKFKMKMYIIM